MSKKPSFLPRLLAALALTFQIATPSFARPADELTETRKVLKDELDLIETISDGVERLDFARLTVLKLDVTRVLESIEKNGLAHKDTFLAFQVLIQRHRFSQSFFKIITSDERKDEIEKLQTLAVGIAKRYGFDDTPYTRHTYNDFAQIKKLFLQLYDMPISEGLKTKISQLDGQLGKVLGVAKADGDRPVAFDLGRETYFMIQKIYPDLEEVAVGNAAYEIVIEIQGLNESYAEFAQVYRDTHR